MRRFFQHGDVVRAYVYLVAGLVGFLLGLEHVVCVGLLILARIEFGDARRRRR